MDTKIKGEVRTEIRTIADATVIEVGDLVEDSSGVIIKATATADKIARAQEASAVGDTQITVSKGEIEMEMDAADVFAVTQKGGEYDVIVDGGQAKINQSGNSLKVLMMDGSIDAGTVGSASSVKVKINKPLDERA